MKGSLVWAAGFNLIISTVIRDLEFPYSRCYALAVLSLFPGFGGGILLALVLSAVSLERAFLITFWT